MWRISTFLKPRDEEAQRRALVDGIKASLDLIASALLRCNPSAGSAEARSAEALRSRGSELLAEAATADPEELERLEEAGDDLARQRAYLMTLPKIRFEAHQKVQELASWSVPKSVLSMLDPFVAATKAKDLEEARSGLYRILEDFDYWDDYTDWFHENTRRISAVLTVAAVLLLLLALAWTHQPMLVPAFLAAGLSGSCVSILAKLPPLTPYGQVAGSWTRMLYRLAAGATGTVVGLSLVLFGILPLATPEGGEAESVLSIARVCIDGTAECSLSSRLMLLGIALLLGFSERILKRSEKMIGGTDDDAKSDS